MSREPKYTDAQIVRYITYLITEGAFVDKQVLADMLRSLLAERQSLQAARGVSDEDVDAAVDIYEKVYNGNDLGIREKMRAPDTECMRAALEHFAKSRDGEDTIQLCDGCGSNNLITKCCDCDNETHVNRDALNAAMSVDEGKS